MENNRTSFKSLAYTFLLGAVVGIGLTVFIAIKYNLYSGYENSGDATAVELTHKKDANDNVNLSAATALMLDLSPIFVEDEMTRNGRVIRTKKKASKAVEAAISDESIRVKIVQGYANDPVLARSVIKVQSRNGKVSLSGGRLPPGFIGRAIVLAYNTEGVISVASTIEIKLRQQK